MCVAIVMTIKKPGQCSCDLIDLRRLWWTDRKHVYLAELGTRRYGHETARRHSKLLFLFYLNIIILWRSKWTAVGSWEIR
jgi:hypothetical protein